MVIRRERRKIKGSLLIFPSIRSSLVKSSLSSHNFLTMIDLLLLTLNAIVALLYIII